MNATAEYHALTCAVEHPTSLHPYRSVFNQRSFEALADAGVSIDVVSPTPYAPPVGPYSGYYYLPKREEWDAYTIHHPRFLYALPKRLFYHLSGDSLAKRLPPYLERTFDVPDVVHTADIYLDGYGTLPYCREHDLPLFVTSHAATLPYYDSLNRFAQRRIRETLSYCEKVFCVSGPLAAQAAALTDPSKVEVLPIGADPGNFPVEDEAEIREELRIDPDTPVVLFVGRFVEEKGTEELVSAVRDLQVDDLHLVCIGHVGDQLSRVIEELEKTPYTTQVLQGISTPAVRRWFAIADLLVLPSHREGRPTVIYEAMASETCVLASRVGGIPEQVADGETGVIVPPKDAEAFRAALSELLSNGALLEKMGERGYERLIEQGWTWEQHAAELMRYHRTAIE